MRRRRRRRRSYMSSASLNEEINETRDEDE
jgi:hypothetical protein